MTRKSTINLTKHELEMAADTFYPFMKQQIMHKMIGILDEVGQYLAANVFDNNPMHKVTKGENYKLLPYVVVDCPQLSGPHLPLACRTLFWWGYGFSFNLIVPQSVLGTQAAEVLGKLEDWILVGDHLWENEIDEENYQIGTSQTKTFWEHHIQNQAYLRIAHPLPMNKYDVLSELALEWYGKHIRQLTA